MNLILNLAKAVLFINYAAFFALVLLCAFDGITYVEASWSLAIIGTLSVICLIPFEIRNRKHSSL